MKLQRCPSVCWGTIGSDLLLWSQADRRLHVLNTTAANVWLETEHRTTITELVARLGEMYGAAPDTIRADVDVLIDRFLDTGMCVEVDPADEPTTVLRPPPIPLSRPHLDDLDQRTIRGPFQTLGLPLIIETNDALLRSELARVLDPLRDPSRSVNDLCSLGTEPLIHLHIASQGGSWEVRSNERLIGRAGTRSHALRTVLSEVNAAPLPHLTSSVVFHAAGVDLGDGLVLLPGVSNSGKSTLVTQLMSRGHGYLTDEAVAIDVESLQAQPFHKSICLERGSQDLLPALAPSGGLTTTWDVDPRDIESAWLAPEGVVSAVVFPTFRVDAAPEIRPLQPFDALQQLLANAFDFEHVGQPAFSAIVRMANALPFYSLVHGGGTAPLELLENLFAPTRAETA